LADNGRLMRRTRKYRSTISVNVPEHVLDGWPDRIQARARSCHRTPRGNQVQHKYLQDLSFAKRLAMRAREILAIETGER